MAQQWTKEAACALVRQWNRSKAEAPAGPGLPVGLDELEAWLREQKPASLAEADRLLELITAHEAGAHGDLAGLCQVGGAVRNDVSHHRSRVDVSFAPRASGPRAGRA